MVLTASVSGSLKRTALTASGAGSLKRTVLTASCVLYTQVSKMFDGKEFCVINGPKGLSKEDMERKIAEVCGGRTYMYVYVYR